MEKAAKKGKSRLSLIQRRKVQGSVFLLPVLIGLAVVFLPAMFLSLRLSFSNMSIKVGGYELSFVGLEHYKDAFFVNDTFRKVLLDSVLQLWVQVLIVIIFSLFMAVILNQKFHGRGLARAILFLPVILATGLVTKVDSMATAAGMGGVVIDNLDTGALGGFDFVQLEQVLYDINFMPGLVDVVVTAVNSLYNVVLNSGVQILVFLAGLQSISPSLYEAGKVDGITAWQSFWKITIPMISPLILVNVIYSVIASFTDTSNGVISFIQGYMKQINQYPFASALSWIYFLVMIVAIVVIMLVSRKLVYYNN